MLAWVSKDQLWGLINSSGKTIISHQWTEVNPFKNGVATVKRHDYTCIIDTKGNILEKSHTLIQSIK